MAQFMTEKYSDIGILPGCESGKTAIARNGG